MSANPANAQTGDLLLRAGCWPDPVPATASTHLVEIENSGPDDLYVKEVHVMVGGGLSNTALRLERYGCVATSQSVRLARIYPQWASGTWNWLARPTPPATRRELIVTTILFDRSAALDRLDPDPPVSLKCPCTVDVMVS